jgi:diguanylate cyclase (GGDEF)-like protein
MTATPDARIRLVGRASLHLYRPLTLPVAVIRPPLTSKRRGDMIPQLQKLHTASQRVALSIGFVIYAALALAEFSIPPYFSLTPIYVLNVALVSWMRGRRWGLAFAALATSAQLLANVRAVVPADHVLSFYANDLSALIGYTVVAILVGSMRTMYEREQVQGRLDFLTDTLNRRGFYEALAAEVARSRRSATPVSVAYMDCDNFKVINDTIGHAAGDDALQAVAKRAKSVLRKSDSLARVGGDEFALIFPDTNAQGAADAVNKLRHELDECMGEKGLAVSFSFGLVTFASPPASPDEVLALCDSLMYEAKRSGKRAMVQREYTASEAAHLSTS